MYKWIITNEWIINLTVNWFTNNNSRFIDIEFASNASPKLLQNRLRAAIKNQTDFVRGIPGDTDTRTPCRTVLSHRAVAPNVQNYGPFVSPPRISESIPPVVRIGAPRHNCIDTLRIAFQSFASRQHALQTHHKPRATDCASMWYSDLAVFELHHLFTNLFHNFRNRAPVTPRISCLK
jgi:hypothetical protein